MKIILNLNTKAKEFKLEQIKLLDSNNMQNIIPVENNKLHKKIIRPIKAQNIFK